MLFEGSEKKVEISVDPQLGSLREWGDDYWAEIVAASEAQILSSVKNDKLSAYLLSESSLFVYDHHMIMITCGTTNLVNAVMKLGERVENSQIQALFYERKHEVFPRKQPTTFFNDIERLNSLVPGKAFRFGDEDEHHLFLFHSDRPYHAPSDDVTLEVLMHGVQGPAKELFASKTEMSREQICRETGIHSILPGFQVDDHFFEPEGYSLNAIRDEDYYTFHVTPQEIGSYVSFETNYNYRQEGNPVATIEKVIGIFKPKSFDVVLFEPHVLEPLDFSAYRLKEEVIQPLNCGYNVGFYSYFQPPKGPVRAFELGN